MLAENPRLDIVSAECSHLRVTPPAQYILTMLLTIYVQPDHTADGQCTFLIPAGPIARQITVEVVHGTELVGIGGTTYLKDRHGKLHSAREVLTFCQTKAEGYRLVTQRG